MGISSDPLYIKPSLQHKRIIARPKLHSSCFSHEECLFKSIDEQQSKRKDGQENLPILFVIVELLGEFEGRRVLHAVAQV